MIRLYDNRFGEHGQKIQLVDGKFQLVDGKYNGPGANGLIAMNASEVWPLLKQINGVSVKGLQTASKGNLIVFARPDAQLAELPFYTLAEVERPLSGGQVPAQFRLDTGNLMGVLSLRQGDTALKIQVRSRFDTGEKQYFLNYLLSRIFEVSFTELVSSSDDALWDMLLAFVFLWRFSSAATIGLYKQYHRFEYNDLNFRGRLDLDRHLKRNYPLNDRIAYSRREITFDNPINHLLRHAAAKVEKKWPSMLVSNQNAREQLLLLKQNTPSWTPGDIQRTLSQKDTLSELRQPYFAEYYEPLRKVARMLLTDEGANVFDTPENGNDTEISGVLFDGSWLWEEYLATVLCNRNNGQRRFFHADTNDSKTAIFTFKDKNTSSVYGPLFPDFRRPGCDGASFPQRCDIILDAKYKRGDRVQSKDLHQVLCYMFLTGATQGGLIFPPKTEADDTDTAEDPLAETEIDANSATEDPLAEKPCSKERQNSQLHCDDPANINTPDSSCVWRCFQFLPLKTDKSENEFIVNMHNQEHALRKFAESPKDFDNNNIASVQSQS